MSAIKAIAFKPATPAFRITCCECGGKVGETDCEITATSFHHCDQCHTEYLAEVSAKGAN